MNRINFILCTIMTISHLTVMSQNGILKASRMPAAFNINQHQFPRHNPRHDQKLPVEAHYNPEKDLRFAMSPSLEQQDFHDRSFEPWVNSLSFSDHYGKHAQAIKSYRQAHTKFQWDLESDPYNHELHNQNLHNLWEHRINIENRMEESRQKNRKATLERLFDTPLR